MFYHCCFRMSSLLARFFCLQICIDGRQSAMARACHLLGLHLISCQGHRHLQLCPRGTLCKHAVPSKKCPQTIRPERYVPWVLLNDKRRKNKKIIETKMIISFAEVDFFMSFKLFRLLSLPQLCHRFNVDWNDWALTQNCNCILCLGCKMNNNLCVYVCEK